MATYKGVFIFRAAAHGETAVIRDMTLNGRTLEEAEKQVLAITSMRFVRWDTLASDGSIAVRTLYPIHTLHSVEILEIKDVASYASGG